MTRLFQIICLIGITAYSAPAIAQMSPQDVPPQGIKRVVEKIPDRTARTDNLYRVSASKTPSGFPVPRYVSLKVGKVNGRTGPSLEHAIAWQYRRKGLPLIVVAETEMWRKVRDISGDESWMHKPALSGLRRALVLRETTLHSKPKDRSRVTAIIERNALLELEECNENNWCKVRAADGYKGWTQRDTLWGAQKLY